MPTEESSDVKFEIGHVLFVDIVGYSKLQLALQQLEAGLHAPAASYMLSFGALKLHPIWDPLRGDPRFEKIVESLAPKEKQ